MTDKWDYVGMEVAKQLREGTIDIEQDKWHQLRVDVKVHSDGRTVSTNNVDIIPAEDS